MFIDIYKAKLKKGELLEDSAQKSTVLKLQQSFELIESHYHTKKHLDLSKLFIFSDKTNLSKCQGIYLWGEVGRGKTLLMDLFYETLTFKKKSRFHFHRFMQMIHEELEELQDYENPLTLVAKNLAKKFHLICLDEIFVMDITDAMLLSALFKNLFENQVSLLFTSNQHPAELYKNGLQRKRFLPAIKLIEQNCNIMEIEGNLDFRLRALEKAQLYQMIDNPMTEQNMELFFSQMAGTQFHADREDLIINYRKLPVKKWESGIVWFTFDMICNTHRDSSDYIRIATFFHTVMISDVYMMSAEQDDVCRRFINLVDIFYDRFINVNISAEVYPHKLYNGIRLKNEFKRTSSRLNEMQSADYLAKAKAYKSKIEDHLIDVAEQKNNLQFNDPTRFGDWVNNGRCTDF